MLLSFLVPFQKVYPWIQTIKYGVIYKIIDLTIYTPELKSLIYKIICFTNLLGVASPIIKDLVTELGLVLFEVDNDNTVPISIS